MGISRNISRQDVNPIEPLEDSSEAAQDSIDALGLFDPMEQPLVYPASDSDSLLMQRHATCKDCMVSLGNDAPEGFVSVVVKPGDVVSSSRMGLCSSDEISEAIQAELANGRKLAVTYDLRSTPRDLTRGGMLTGNAAFLSSFFIKEKGLVSTLGLASLASVLFRGSLFKETTVAFLGEVVKLIEPSCPLILCHSKRIAQSFFMAAVRDDAAQGDFVSIVGLRAGKCTPSGMELCVASLAAAKRTTTATTVASPKTTYKLPNGDVRVIQSAPADYIVTGRQDLLDIAEDTVTAAEDVVAVADQQLSVKAQSSPAAAAAAASQDVFESGEGPFSALLLEGPVQSLRLLVAAHFSVTELLIDADLLMDSEESRSSASSSYSSYHRSRQRKSSTNKQEMMKKMGTPFGCITAWLFSCVEAVAFPLAAQMQAPLNGRDRYKPGKVPRLKIRTRRPTSSRREEQQHMQHYGY